MLLLHASLIKISEKDYLKRMGPNTRPSSVYQRSTDFKYGKKTLDCDFVEIQKR